MRTDSSEESKPLTKELDARSGSGHDARLDPALRVGGCSGVCVPLCFEKKRPPQETLCPWRFKLD